MINQLHVEKINAEVWHAELTDEYQIIVGSYVLKEANGNTTLQEVENDEVVKLNSLIATNIVNGAVDTTTLTTLDIIYRADSSDFPIVSNLLLRHGETVQLLNKYIYVKPGHKIMAKITPNSSVNLIGFGEVLTGQ